MSTIFHTPAGTTVMMRSLTPEGQDTVDALLGEFPDAVLITIDLQEDGSEEWWALVREEGGGFKWDPVEDLGRPPPAATLSRIK